ncbi:membrane protein [gut metagenome]|uniref:Membrane protein n=1 Tax=gut metagenome TaxID=749906 RepID=J9G4Y6_9ZZZZ
MLLSDISVAPVMVAAAIEALTFQILVVCYNQVSNIQRNLRAFFYQVFLQLNSSLQTFVLILHGCDFINHFVSLSVCEVMIVGTGTGVEQVTIYEVNLGVFVPSPQEQLLFAIFAVGFQSSGFHRFQVNLNADLSQVSLNNSCNLLVRSTSCVGKSSGDAAIRIAGFSHQFFSAFQVIIITLHVVVEAPQTTVQNGFLQGAFAVESSIKNDFLSIAQATA